tara:strand:- start:612 stop:1097 length:486 start_codon:yes stop_codon:yes gene_type:complete
MGTCEMCGSERVMTLLSEISGTRLRCCNRCIESNNLNILEKRNVPLSKPRAPLSPVRAYTKNMSKLEKEVMPDFHRAIKRGREAKGWSSRDLAMRLNLRLNDIQKAEAGVQPADSTLEKIEKALDIKLFEDNISEPERSVRAPSSRGMTIGDALDEFLGKE